MTSGLSDGAYKRKTDGGPLSDIAWIGDSDEKGNKYVTVENGVHNGKNNNTKIGDDEEDMGCFNRAILSIQNSASAGWKANRKWIIRVICLILAGLYLAYFGYAMYYEFGSERSIRLMWMTCFVIFMLVVLKLKLWGRLCQCLSPCTDKISNKAGSAISIAIGLIVLIGALVFVIVDAIVLKKQPYNLVSLSGICLYILIVFITSANPARVKWRTVLWGINLQLLLALIILRWSVGFSVVQWISDRFVIYIDYTNAGSEFAFGKDYVRHWFAFKAMPVVVFVSSTIAVLYHLGVMQRTIQIIGWILQKLMDTTAAESMAAAGNIFVGNTEAPLLILPMVKDMTKSELHCLMVGGFATIAGSAFGTFVVLGARPDYLIAASVMSAPAALALAKLSYPETEQSKTTVTDVGSLHKSPYRNIIEAASSGAINSIKLVANITVNIIAFLSILAFVNEVLMWLGHRAGLYDPPLTFGLICSYLLFPFALSMGVELEYCRKVAEILGVKAFINAAFAYRMLGVLRSNNEVFAAHMQLNGTTYENVNNNIILFGPGNTNQTLENGILSERSLAIATFSLCGFASFDSIGIVLGALVAMVPSRKSDLSQLVIRAVIMGNIASYMTGCFAGLLYQNNM